MGQASFQVLYRELSDRAKNHYVNLIYDCESNYVSPGIVGNGLFVRNSVWPGRVITEYTGVRMSHAEAERVTFRRAAQGIHEEYQLSIAGVDNVIDGMKQNCDGKFANHS